MKNALDVSLDGGRRLHLWFLLLLLLFFFSSFPSPSSSYKILMLPIQQKSHLYCNLAIAKALALRGHRTYMLLSQNTKIDDRMQLVGSEAGVVFVRYTSRENAISAAAVDADEIMESIARMMVTNRTSFVEMLKANTHWSEIESRLLLVENEEMIEQFRELRFDIAIVDGTFFSKYLYLVAHRLGVPWITYTDYPDPWLMKVPWLSSFVPGQFASISERMDFRGRLWNTFVAATTMLNGFSWTVSDEIMRKYQSYGSFDSLDDLMGRSELWILTSDPLIDYVKPTMPHMVEVGGLTVEPPAPLSADFKSFLDGSEDGAILISFGSMLSIFPDHLMEKFLSALNRVKGHRIVWRMQNPDRKRFEIPSHVKHSKWIPQNEILAHPKIKLFITHCGNNGQFESLYHGVPMIGFPFIGDQHYNAIRLQYKGYGIGMDIHEFTSDELYSNILKILDDSSGYKERIATSSQIFRSALQRPAEKAAYWIEHVIRFGSGHLRSAGKDLNFFQYYLLDVLSVFAVSLILVAVATWKMSAFVMRRVLRRFRSKDKLKKNE